MNYRPQFHEYIMARIVTTSVSVFLIFATLIFLLIDNLEVVTLSIVVIGISFMFFIYIILAMAKRMRKELLLINHYLENIDKMNNVTYKPSYFTQEFEDINQNIIKVLKASKKREEVKQRYTAKLKLKNRQRGDMISAIAHEFRNPIASIMGYAQTLEDDKEIPQALQSKFLNKIYNNGVKIEALLSRLVLWNRFESGEATLHPTSFDMYSLFVNIKNSLKEKYPTRDIMIEASSCSIEADRTLIEVVLKNLMENALKYSEDAIVIKMLDKKISVIDKGTGISSSDIGKITKKFYRSGTHTWDNSMGLGLSIVKSILTLHNTVLEIESTEGKGSSFSFNIVSDGDVHKD